MGRVRVVAKWAAALVVLASDSIAQTQFLDVSDAAGVNQITESYGASWGDINSDGYLDIYASNHRNRPSLYVYQGNGRFVDMAPQITPWVNFPTRDTHGASFADYDNDGDQDFMVSAGAGNPTQFYINNNGALAERATELGVNFEKLGGRLPIWLDHNEDGLLDNIMANFGGVAKLFTRSGAGFVENTTTVGLLCSRFQYGQFHDVNNDGRLDFVCADDPVYPQKIYDTGPDRWVDVTSQFPGVGHVADSIAGDFDNDLHMDMFLLSNVQVRPSSAEAADANTVEARLVGSSKGFNFISNGAITVDIDWKPLDNGALHRVRVGSGAVIPGGVPFTLDPSDPNVVGMPPSVPTGQGPRIRVGFQPGPNRWTIIYDSDSQVSSPETYFVVTTAEPLSNLVATGLWVGDRPAQPTLILNHGNSYSDGTSAAGLAHNVQCVSATVGDFDNDEDLDLYLGCRTGVANIANRYYDNQGNGTFVLVPNAGGAAGLTGTNLTDRAGVAETVIAGDYDVDGFIDLFVTNGLNLRPLYTGGGPTKLFHNQGNGNHWIQLDLHGTNSTRDPIGARVIATTPTANQLRVFGSGYHRWAQEPNRMHFGLGANTQVDLTVHWPSGNTEVHPGVAADKLYRVTEGAGLTVVVPGTNQGPGGGGPPGSGDTCFAPPYTAAAESHLFLWDSCDGSGLWNLRTTAGGRSLVFRGGITASEPLTSVTPYSYEASDVLDLSNPLAAIFEMRVFGSGEDGLSFGFADGSAPCLDANMPSGSQVLVGRDRKPATLPLNLETLQSCGPPPPTTDCGAPTYSASGDDGIFVWKDCAADNWRVVAVAGNGFKRFMGGITADQDFSSVTGVSIEANDVLDNSTASEVRFDMRVAPPNFDGFDFSLPCSAAAQFNLSAPAGVPIYVGKSRTTVPVPFDLSQTAVCTAP